MAMSTGGGGSMSDINVTPLVDVMLVLLIIFMVTAPMMNQGVDIDLPKADAPPLNMDAEDQLILTIDRDLQFFINDSSFSVDEMPTKLAAIAKANPGQAIFVQADGDVPYREVARLLGAAKLAGFPRVGMVFSPEED